MGIIGFSRGVFDKNLMRKNPAKRGAGDWFSKLLDWCEDTYHRLLRLL